MNDFELKKLQRKVFQFQIKKTRTNVKVSLVQIEQGEPPHKKPKKAKQNI